MTTLKYRRDNLIAPSQAIKDLKRYAAHYDGATKLIVASKNRLHATNPKAEWQHQDEIIPINDSLQKTTKELSRLLPFWPIWRNGLVNVIGVGPTTAANLILNYYYRFTPICKKCKTPYSFNGEKGKKLKCSHCGKEGEGGGLLEHKITRKNFKTISKWQMYCGIGRDKETGEMPSRKKGQKITWNPRAKDNFYQIAEQFKRHKHNKNNIYGKILIEEYVPKYMKKFPKNTKGHNWNIAKGCINRLFASHFWTVARAMENKPVSGPYSEVILGHTNITRPWWYDGEIKYKKNKYR